MIAKLDIIIVNWNSGNFVSECIESISCAIIQNFKLNRLVVVDNGSSDDSLSKIKPNNLPLIVIKNEQNFGFGKACNQGAIGSEADYLLMLNPDTRLNENSLWGPIKFMEKKDNKNIGVIGIQIYNDKNEISRNCARFPTPLKMIYRSIGLDKLFPQIFQSHFMTEWDHKNSRIVDQVMGSFFMIRRKLFNDLNGFDERFFVYYEDLDLALRARKKSYFNYYLADASIYHKGGGVTENIKSKRMFINLQSKILFARKHFNFRTFIIVYFVILMLEPIARILGAVFRGSFSTIVQISKAYKELYKSNIFNKNYNIPDK
ncbi:MAG: glycosyltransferase family 2 protein [Ignavibacteriales bacterium CG12_big_fil_rev_8_21_14_0_65_30_8]|nr:MAG: glycosyltransferase family 2 protein [Ignavibacteriales bacterium CG12_big_fil_rev_8_21_14_0_65_30_8]